MKKEKNNSPQTKQNTIDGSACRLRESLVDDKTEDISNLSDKIGLIGNAEYFHYRYLDIEPTNDYDDVIQLKDVKHHLKAFLDELKGEIIWDYVNDRSDRGIIFHDKLERLSKKHFGGLAE